MTRDPIASATSACPDRHPRPRAALPAVVTLGALVATGCTSTPSQPTAPDGDLPPGPAPGETCEAPVPGRRLLRRLSRSEYDRTVTALLGFPSDHGARFAADTVVAGYDNDAGALVVSPLLADQLRIAAEELSAAAVAELARVVPCALPPADPEGCARALAQHLGERAYRRPVTARDVTRLMAVYAAGSADEGFAGGIRWMIAAMLQSPSFLYRRELGVWDGVEAYTLDPWERASELSYFFTGSMPDETLFELARSGALADPAVVEREARRLWRDPRALGRIGELFRAWLETERLDSVPKDSDVFPELDGARRLALREETERFIAHVLFEGSGTLSELLTSEVTIAGPDLAAFYGVAPPERPGPGGAGVIRPAPGHTAGLLTQGSVLTTHARANGSSPVHRGKLIRERLLCQPLPPPPPGLMVEPPPVDPTLTGRQRYAAHSAIDACAGCHRAIDPIGLAFEHFDGIGRFRETENGHAIDDTGEIVGSAATNGTFSGTRGLALLLAESLEVSDCFAEHWARFAYGVAPFGPLECVTASVAATLASSGGRVEELAIALMTAPHAERRLGPPPPGVEPPVEPPPPEEPPVEEPPPPMVSRVVLREDSRWETGYCASVTVTNLSDAPLDWTATLAIEGTLTQHWNAEASATEGEVTFSGVSWNDVLPPGEAASFGFCAAL